MSVIVKFFKLLYRIWMKFAHLIGKVNTFILLTLFYFVFLGVAKAVLVLMRKDPLDGQWKDRTSYWKKREDFKADRESLLRPY